MGAVLFGRPNETGSSVPYVRVIVLEYHARGWHYLFEHGDRWPLKSLVRPSAAAPLACGISTRADTTSAGLPVLCWAGAVDTAVHRAILQMPGGERELTVDPVTGAFVLVTAGTAFSVALEALGGERLYQEKYRLPLDAPEVGPTL